MASPIVCVLKGKQGKGGIRLCCDYRYVNKYTKGDAYPTPDITDVIHCVGKARYISTWDARSVRERFECLIICAADNRVNTDC